MAAGAGATTITNAGTTRKGANGRFADDDGQAALTGSNYAITNVSGGVFQGGAGLSVTNSTITNSGTTQGGAAGVGYLPPGGAAIVGSDPDYHQHRHACGPRRQCGRSHRPHGRHEHPGPDRHDGAGRHPVGAGTLAVEERSSVTAATTLGGTLLNTAALQVRADLRFTGAGTLSNAVGVVATIVDGGTLSVTDGAHHFAAHLDGRYAASGFSLTHTRSGETVHYAAPKAG